MSIAIELNSYLEANRIQSKLKCLDLKKDVDFSFKYQRRTSTQKPYLIKSLSPAGKKELIKF